MKTDLNQPIKEMKGRSRWGNTTGKEKMKMKM